MHRRIADAIPFLVLLLALPLVATLLGYYVGSWASGVDLEHSDPQQVPWQALDAPPEKPVKIVAADVDTIAMATSDGTVYYWRSTTGWQKVDQIPAMGHSEPFSDIAHPPPPSGVVDHITAAARGEAGTYTEYVILADGSVWQWKFTQPGLGSLVAFVYGLGGAGAGLALGVGLSIGVWRKARRGPAIR